MGCASCGQKYRAATSRFIRRPNTLSKRKVGGTMQNERGKTIVQPQPEAAVAVPVPAIPVDPSTGHEISVIKTGEPTLGSIAPTEPVPLTVVGKPGTEGADE